MRVKISLCIIGFLVLAGITGVLVYRKVGFYVTSTSPKDGSTASVKPTVEINFNRTLDGQTAASFKISPSVVGKLRVEDKTLFFTPEDELSLGAEYTISIDKPVSTDGKTMEAVILHFKSDYLDFSKLDQVQKENAIEKTDSIERDNPLIGSLPQENLHYRIDYSIDPKGKLIYDIKLFASINRPSQRSQYLSQLKQYKKEALDYIRSKGVDPKSLTVHYSPKDAESL